MRINTHRSSCSERYLNPRFSMALGLAAEVGHLGVDYDPDDFLGLCHVSMPDPLDIIQMKNEQKPPLTF